MTEKTEQAEVQQETPAAQAAPAEGAAESKKKKIRLMTEKEIEQALAKSREQMGGDKSAYVRHLLERQAELKA